MAMISLTFSGATMEEVASLIATWVPPVTAPRRDTSRIAPENDDAAIQRVLSGVHGQQSRRLLRYLAEAGLHDSSVQLNTALVKEFGVSGGTAFSGMIGPVNRRAEKLLGRPLIEYPSSDPKARIWRIAPEDAQAVLDALDAD